jgi:hypothetical protein
LSIENTSRVELESILVSFNSDGDGLKSNSGLEGIQVVGSDVNVLGDLGNGSAGLARSSLSSVGVRSFRAKSIVADDVLEGIIHQSSIASLVSKARRAVNQLLLRERNKLSSLEGMSSFNGSSGGERPARSTLSLVLDGGNSVVISPVDGIRNSDQSVHVQGNSGNGSINSRELQSSLLGLEFSKGHISEFVDIQSPRSLLSIVVGDQVVVGLEDVVSMSIFSSRVALVVGDLELGELVLVFLLRDTEGRYGKDGQNSKDESHCSMKQILRFSRMTELQKIGEWQHALQPLHASRP